MLTEEGSEILQNGSHEVRLFNAVDPKKGTPQEELLVELLHGPTIHC